MVTWFTVTQIVTRLNLPSYSTNCSNLNKRHLEVRENILKSKYIINTSIIQY